MASPPYGSRSYSPASPSYRQMLLYSLRPTSPPSPPAPDYPSSLGSPLSTLDANWWSPRSPTWPISSPSSPIYSPTSPGRLSCTPSPSSSVYWAVHSPTSPNYCPDEEFNNWASHTSPAPGSPVYCHTRQTSLIHGNSSRAADSPIRPGYFPGEFNDHASPVLLGSLAFSPMSPGLCAEEFNDVWGDCPREFNDHASPVLLGSSLAFSPMSPGLYAEEFNDVWGDITLAGSVQTPASPKYCYCCSTTLKDCCYYQPSDDAPAP